MPMTPKEMVKLLKANGFVEMRQNGSHKVFENKETGKIIPTDSIEIREIEILGTAPSIE